MKLLPIAGVAATCAGCAYATPLGTRNNYNVSLENPALFSLHWQMLEKNSTSGCTCFDFMERRSGAGEPCFTDHLHLYR